MTELAMIFGMLFCIIWVIKFVKCCSFEDALEIFRSYIADGLGLRSDTSFFNMASDFEFREMLWNALECYVPENKIKAMKKMEEIGEPTFVFYSGVLEEICVFVKMDESTKTEFEMLIANLVKKYLISHGISSPILTDWKVAGRDFLQIRYAKNAEQQNVITKVMKEKKDILMEHMDSVVYDSELQKEIEKNRCN